MRLFDFWGTLPETKYRPSWIAAATETTAAMERGAVAASRNETRRVSRRALTITAWLVVALAAGLASAAAQDNAAAPSFFPHPAGRFYFAGQANYIYQENGQFPAAYSGPNSFTNLPDDALSRVLTFYSGAQIDSSTEVLFDLEETGGAGLSGVLGLAAATDLDAVRNPTLSKKPYIARIMLHKVWGWGGETVTQAPGPLSTFANLPARRLELYAGKFSLVDFFDANSVGSDSHLQFMNWTIDNNGAYDYAANTRGYTMAVMVEYQSPRWGARFAEALMPTVANGTQLQWDLRRARAENAEIEFRPAGAFWKRHPATWRLLGYDNRANMGIYRLAIDNYLAGQTPQPEIAAHPPWTTSKPGMGLNLEQQITDSLHAFGRLGFADGRYESFAYTEVEQTVSFGAALSGQSWERPSDKFGTAFVVDGISGDHRRYLALGGLGFLLGDGALSYAHEKVEETFYTFALGRGFSIAPDAQYVVDPGYNRARGPFWVTSARLHVDF